MSFEMQNENSNRLELFLSPLQESINTSIINYLTINHFLPQ